MIKRLIFLQLFTFCFVHFGFSQVSRKVVIIQNDQSKTLQLISKPDQNQYKELVVLEESVPKTYFPKDLTSFVLPDGRKFVSTQVRGSQGRVFMQLPLEGKVSLGFFGNTFHLIVDDEAIPLTVDSRSDFASESRELKRKTYLGVLHFGLGDCDEKIDSQINETNLSYPALERLLIAYHGCKELPYQLHGKDQKFLKVGFSAALGYSQIQSDLERVRYLTQPGGLRGEVMLNFVSEKFSPRIRTEIGFALTQFDQLWGIGLRDLPPGQQQNRYEELAQIRAIDIPFVVNYSLMKSEKNDVYFGLGLKFTVHQKEIISELSQFEFRQEIPPFDLATRPKDPILLNMDNRQGVLIKLGYSMKISRFAVFSEIQADRIVKAGFLQLANQEISEYSYNSFSGKVGIRF